jgi:hypothetical protein
VQEGDDGVNYIDYITGMLAALLGDCPPDLLRFYALLVLIQGHCTSLEDVHDAWACWRVATKPEHPSLVPFGALTPEVQELDRKYMEAIREVSAEIRGAVA